MKTLIVDDVKLSRDGIQALITTYMPEAQIIGSVPSVAEARRVIRTEPVDLLFLDIQLQDGIGFDVLDDVPFNTKVIFITAYEKYAVEAVRTGAFDYLLKPVNVEEFKKTIARIREAKAIELEHAERLTAGVRIFEEKLGISSLDGIDYLEVVDINYLKADGKYTEICLKGPSNMLSSKNLKMFELVLPESRFLRVHHSFLVNMAEIRRFVKEDSMLILNDGSNVPVSKSRKEMLMKRLIHI